MQILMLKSGSGKYNINAEQVKDIRVPLVDLDRQDEIVVVIKAIEEEARDLSRRAAGVRASIANLVLEQLGIQVQDVAKANYFFKTGAERQTLWFAEFPDGAAERLHYLFFHPRYQVLGKLAANYKTTLVSDICQESIIRGEQPEYDDTGDMLVLKTVDLKNGYIDYDNALRVSQEFFEKYPNAHVRKGDVLISTTGYVSMGKIDVYERDTPAMISGELLALRVKPEYDPYFICYYLRSHMGQIQFDKYFSGSSGQIHIYDTDIAHFVVPKSDEGGVSFAEQQRIAVTITDKLDLAHEFDRRPDCDERKQRTNSKRCY